MHSPLQAVRTRVSISVTVALVVAMGLVGLTNARAAARPGDTLLAGSVLANGQSIQSANGNYRLVMQSDGNLVLYNASNTALWNTGTANDGPSELAVQTDGNLVVYSGTGWTWQSGTSGLPTSRLIMQNDGNLVDYSASGSALWASNTPASTSPVGGFGPTTSAPPPPAPPKPVSRLMLNTAISGGQQLTSPNGLYRAVMQADGNFVVYGPNGPDWNSNTTGRTNAKLILQSSGNLVVQSGAGINVFSTGTSGGAWLTMQSDGNLVLYSSKSVPLWYVTPATPRPDGALQRGEKLAAGDHLYSADGAYWVTQQTDGNLVVYATTGATWATNTANAPTGTYSTLQTDGNFVLYTPANGPLFFTGTKTGNQLVIQDDGNLVLYDASRNAVWYSKHSPIPPPGFAATASAAPTSTSHYVRNLSTNVTSNTAIMKPEGCADAKANPSGHPYLAILAFGAEVQLGSAGWGAQLTATTIQIPDSTVVSAVEAYIDGYTGCMVKASWMTVAVATNNDGDDAALGSGGGNLWATKIIEPLQAYTATRAGITIAGSDDMEPGFAGSAGQAASWLSGYLAATDAPFVFVGSADGCPTTLGASGGCNLGWTQTDLYNLAYGAAPGRSFPMPEIYFDDLANQWANISLAGYRMTGQPAAYAGPLTEVTACAQAHSCASLPAAQAWSALMTALAANGNTRLAGMLYATDLRIN